MTLASSAKPVEGSVADAVHAERIRLLVQHDADRLITIVNTAIVIAIVRGLYPDWLLALWFVLSTGLALAWPVLSRRFLARPRDHASVQRWSVVFAVCAMATGLLWGAAGLDILQTSNISIQLITIIIVGGMMAGGVSSNAAYLPAMLGYAVPTALPAFVALLIRHSALHQTVAAIIALCATVMIISALRLNRLISDNIRARLLHDRLLDEAQANDTAMAETQSIAHVGSWDLDLRTNLVAASPETYRIYGLDRHSFVPSFENVTTRVHPDDRPSFLKDFADSIAGKPSFSLDHRLIMENASVRYIHLTAQTIFSAAGEALRMVGTVQDVTERYLAETRLKLANLLLKTQMEASPDGIMVTDANRHMTAYNERLVEMWQLPRDSVLAGDDNVLRPHIEAQLKDRAAYETRVRYLASHPDEFGEAELALADGRYFRQFTRAMPGPAGENLGRVWFFTDITDHKRAAESLVYRDHLLHTVTAATAVAVGALSLADGVNAALVKIG
jgi:PAS domain S-box-containing protein